MYRALRRMISNYLNQPKAELVSPGPAQVYSPEADLRKMMAASQDIGSLLRLPTSQPFRDVYPPEDSIDSVRSATIMQKISESLAQARLLQQQDPNNPATREYLDWVTGLQAQYGTYLQSMAQTSASPLVDQGIKSMVEQRRDGSSVAEKWLRRGGKVKKYMVGGVAIAGTAAMMAFGDDMFEMDSDLTALYMYGGAGVIGGAGLLTAQTAFGEHLGNVRDARRYAKALKLRSRVYRGLGELGQRDRDVRQEVPDVLPDEAPRNPYMSYDRMAIELQERIAATNNPLQKRQLQAKLQQLHTLTNYIMTKHDGKPITEMEYREARADLKEFKTDKALTVLATGALTVGAAFVPGGTEAAVMGGSATATYLGYRGIWGAQHRAQTKFAEQHMMLTIQEDLRSYFKKDARDRGDRTRLEFAFDADRRPVRPMTSYELSSLIRGAKQRELMLSRAAVDDPVHPVHSVSPEDARRIGARRPIDTLESAAKKDFFTFDSMRQRLQKEYNTELAQGTGQYDKARVQYLEHMISKVDNLEDQIMVKRAGVRIDDQVMKDLTGEESRRTWGAAAVGAIGVAGGAAAAALVPGGVIAQAAVVGGMGLVMKGHSDLANEARESKKNLALQKQLMADQAELRKYFGDKHSGRDAVFQFDTKWEREAALVEGALTSDRMLKDDALPIHQLRTEAEKENASRLRKQLGLAVSEDVSAPSRLEARQLEEQAAEAKKHLYDFGRMRQELQKQADSAVLSSDREKYEGMLARATALENYMVHEHQGKALEREGWGSWAKRRGLRALGVTAYAGSGVLAGAAVATTVMTAGAGSPAAIGMGVGAQAAYHAGKHTMKAVKELDRRAEEQNRMYDTQEELRKHFSMRDKDAEFTFDFGTDVEKTRKREEKEQEAQKLAAAKAAKKKSEKPRPISISR